MQSSQLEKFVSRVGLEPVSNRGKSQLHALTVSKCSLHLSSWSLVLVKVAPFRDLTGLSELIPLQDSFLVMLKSVLMSQSAVAAS